MLLSDAALLDLADKAARTVLGRFPQRWTAEDWEDAAQTAALGIWRATQQKPNCGEGYYFSAGRSEIRGWLRQWLRHQSAGPLLEVVPVTEPDVWSPPFSLDQLATLTPLLAQARGRAHSATTKRAERDVRMLWFILQGVTMRRIEEEFGLSHPAAWTARDRLRQRLEQIAAQQGVLL